MNNKLRNVMFGGAFVAAAAMSVPALAANGNLVELTIQTEEHMPDMPQMASIPPQTVTRKICIGAGRFDPQQLLKAESGSDCKLTNYKMSGDVITFDESCTRPAAVTSHGEFHVSGSGDFTGKMHTEMNAAGHAISVDSSYQGKKVGSCDYTPSKY